MKRREPEIKRAIKDVKTLAKARKKLIKEIDNLTDTIDGIFTDITKENEVWHQLYYQKESTADPLNNAQELYASFKRLEALNLYRRKKISESYKKIGEYIESLGDVESLSSRALVHNLADISALPIITQENEKTKMSRSKAESDIGKVMIFLQGSEIDSVRCSNFLKDQKEMINTYLQETQRESITAKAALVAVKKNPTVGRADTYKKKIEQALEGAKQFIEKPDTKNWFVSGLTLMGYIPESDLRNECSIEPDHIADPKLRKEFYSQFQILTDRLIQNLFPHIESNGIKDLDLESVPDEAPKRVLSSHNVQELRGELTKLVSTSEEYKREAELFLYQLASKILGTDVYWDESLLTEVGEAAMSSVSAFNLYSSKIVKILDRTLSSKCQEITAKMNDEDREAAAVGVCLGRVAISAKGVSETSIEYAKRVLAATKPPKREAVESDEPPVVDDGMKKVELNPYADKINALFSSEEQVKKVIKLLKKIELEKPTIVDLRNLLERLGFTPEEALVKVPDSTGGSHPVVKIPNFFGLDSNATPEAITVAIVHGKEDTITRAGLKHVRSLLKTLDLTSESIEKRYLEYKATLAAGASAEAGSGTKAGAGAGDGTWAGAGAGADAGAGAGAGTGTRAGAGAESDGTSPSSWEEREKERISARSSISGRAEAISSSSRSSSSDRSEVEESKGNRVRGGI